MKKLLYLLLIGSILSSCNEYHKALNSEDVATKFSVGEALYNEGKYVKANKLFAQVVPGYRGKPQAEKLMFLYANSFYYMEDFFLASYQFERFATSYPDSDKVEEAEFLSAKSKYLISPVHSKEQHETKEAIQMFQLFLNTYPNSEFTAEANKMAKELDGKLEQKSYDIAYQYYNTVGYTRDYKAAIKAFDNFIFDFPGSKRREDALFYRLDSAYNLAINSVDNKKLERLEIAKTYYLSFVSKYSSSEHLEDQKDMLENIEDELKIYSTKS